MAEIIRCNDKNVCPALQERLVESGRGFYSIDTVSIHHNRTKFQGVAYKKSGKDKGLMLNWCPFCGGKPGIFKRG